MRDGVTTEERDRIKALEREVRELRPEIQRVWDETIRSTTFAKRGTN